MDINCGADISMLHLFPWTSLLIDEVQASSFLVHRVRRKWFTLSVTVPDEVVYHATDYDYK